MVGTSSIIPWVIYFTYQFRVSIPVLFQIRPVSTSTTPSTEHQSDSSRPSSPAMNGKSASASAVAKPPGTQVRCVHFCVPRRCVAPAKCLLVISSLAGAYLLALSRRRATGNTVQKPNSSRAAGAGGSSNTMLKLYTDDSPGLRV